MLSFTLCAFALFILQAALIVAQTSPSVICAAGQCLLGYTNASIGLTISENGSSTDTILLPGQYLSNSNPQYLHDILTSSAVSIHASAGFTDIPSTSAISLPLDVYLDSGIAMYASQLYNGGFSFSALGSAQVNSSVPLDASSLLISPDTYAAFNSISSNMTIIIRDAIPDLSQLPGSLNASSFSLLDLQSTSCSAPCSSAGICTANGTCSCSEGYSGDSCESCASGFYGPSCLACPAGCTECDDGLTGSGQCLAFNVTNSPSTCNCLNGQCDSNGVCQCNAGWSDSSNGTKCASCAAGYFLSSSGNCQICQIGCTECADQTGDCITCKSGYTQDANDETQCLAPQSTTSSGTVCPDGSFSNGITCEACSPSCKTCTAGTSNDCVICAAGSYSFNGSCVSVDGNGVCEGSAMVANNDNHECDACPAKCTSCGIPNFNSASTINEVQCSGCLPGFVLSNGQCVETCPSGTFLSENSTCIACDSSCGSCAGSATFCLTCNNNTLASNGTCVSSCPSNSIKSNSSQLCTVCHPDCATCSGSTFYQCLSCPIDRPILSSGRCLRTCNSGEFFDQASWSCQKCDSSCANCFASDSSSCLACSDDNSVLRNGQCVSATCSNSTTVVVGLGVCLSDLVMAPTNVSNPPIISGLDDPTVVSGGGLDWWKTLLITLFIALLIFGIYLWWRKKTKNARQQLQAQEIFMHGKKRHGCFVAGLLAVKRELVEGYRRTREKREERKDHFTTLAFVEEARRYKANREYKPEFTEMHRPRPSSRRSHHNHGQYSHRQYHRDDDKTRRTNKDLPPPPSLPAHYIHPYNDVNSISGPSLYSQVTGVSRKGVEARQPLKESRVPGHHFPLKTEPSKSTLYTFGKETMYSEDGTSVAGTSRTRATSKTGATSAIATIGHGRDAKRGYRDVDMHPPPTPAQEYVMSVLGPKSIKGKEVDRSGMYSSGGVNPYRY